MPDREKVIKGIEHCVARYVDGLCDDCPYTGEVDNSYMIPMKCKEINIRDALTLLKEPGWISVKDRLPNCNGCYLVWRPHFYPDKGMPSICYFDGQNTWHDSYGVDFTRVLASEDVSHWKPLPEQPCKAVKLND